MTMNAAPLTFGQLSVWRDVTGLPRERWHEGNLSHGFDLPKPVSRRQLAAAATRLQERHPSLRTLLDTGEPPRQLVQPPQEIAIEDVAVAFGDVVDAEARADELKHVAFDLNVDRPFRVLGVASGAEVDDPDAENIVRVHYILHHVAADGWSIGLLLMDTLVLLGFGGELQPTPPHSLLEEAIEQRTSPAAPARLKAAQKHFRSIYAADATSFLDRDGTRGGLEAAVESSELWVAAHEIASAEKVSLSTLFTAAFADAVSGFCHPGPIRMGLMAGNRLTERWRGHVTSMNQLALMLVTPKPAVELKETFADVGINTMRAYRYGIHDVDQMTVTALGIDKDPAEVKYLCMFNFMDGASGQYADEPSSDGTPVVHWEPVFSHISAGCYLRVYETAEQTIRLRLRTGGLTRETHAGILQGMYARVLAAAAAC